MTPSRTNRTPNQRRQQQFLDALRTGRSVSSAAEAAGVGRRTVYDWRQRDQEFAAAWDDAVDEGTDRLEDVALDAALRGSERLLLALLRARRPDRYQRAVLEHTGDISVMVQHATDTLKAKLARLDDA